MNQIVTVRRFQDSDTDDVYAVIRRAYDTSFLRKVYEPCAYQIWTSVYTKAYIRAMAQLKHFYVALSDEKIVGCAAVSLSEGMAYISAVYIDPRCQGKGVGTQLMKTVEQDGICLEAKRIFLHALLTANSFYRKLGYTSEGEIPTVFSDCGVDVVRLYKNLAQ